jgi:hypothetical protein
MPAYWQAFDFTTLFDASRRLIQRQSQWSPTLFDAAQ